MRFWPRVDREGFSNVAGDRYTAALPSAPAGTLRSCCLSLLGAERGGNHSSTVRPALLAAPSPAPMTL